jgi:hypothetical protein
MYRYEYFKVHTKMLFHHPFHMLIPVCFFEELSTLSQIPSTLTRITSMLSFSSADPLSKLMDQASQNTSQVILRVLAGELTNSAIHLI